MDVRSFGNFAVRSRMDNIADCSVCKICFIAQNTLTVAQIVRWWVQGSERAWVDPSIEDSMFNIFVLARKPLLCRLNNLSGVRIHDLEKLVIGRKSKDNGRIVWGARVEYFYISWWALSHHDKQGVLEGRSRWTPTIGDAMVYFR